MRHLAFALLASGWICSFAWAGPKEDLQASWDKGAAVIAAKQAEDDGSWLGDLKWMEDVEPLPTLYSLMCLNKAAKHLK
jgi:hypothetical protein